MNLIKWLIWGGLGILLIFITMGIVSFYSESENQLPIEMVAFNSLTDEERDLILVSPKDSIVKQMPADEIKILINKSYDKDLVYSVTFNNTETNSSGNLVVFVGLDKKTVLGKGFTSK